jgi:AbrB family looped-hinge helix DNA binding protein
MGSEIKISSKGQVVIPKEIRDALRLRAGGTLEVSLQGNRIVMKAPEHKKSGRTTDEIFAELRKLYTHRGPPATIEQMNAAVDAMFAAKSRDEI